MKISSSLLKISLLFSLQIRQNKHRKAMWQIFPCLLSKPLIFHPINFSLNVETSTSA